jgi:ComF family protein
MVVEEDDNLQPLRTQDGDRNAMGYFKPHHPGPDLPIPLRWRNMPATSHTLAARLARATLDLLLPPHCPACSAQVTIQGTLCPTCFAALTFITEPLCTACGLPFASRAYAGSMLLCPTCLDQPPPWREARAALIYDEAARRLILPFKHADRQENAAILAAHMARAGAALLAQADVLVPVPLHRGRLTARGFNQSALLAHALSRRTGVARLPDALVRTRATPSLGALSAVKRAEALDGAIAVRPRRAAAIAGRRVLLIDDVMTSGATAAACARALLDAEAVHIDVLVASRVADPRRPS